MRDLDCINSYWSQASGDYLSCVKAELADSVFMENMGHIIDYHAPGGNDRAVLDIGCGPGFFPVFFGKRGHRIQAVDYSEDMISKAKKNCNENSINADITRMNALDLKYSDCSFDLIVSRNMMWTTPDPSKVYDEMERVLRPGGRLVIFDGNFCRRYHYDDYKALGCWWSKKDDSDRVTDAAFEDTSLKLPSGKMFRPVWDMEKLLSLGMGEFRADVSRENIPGQNKSLVTDFIISAGKQRAR